LEDKHVRSKRPKLGDIHVGHPGQQPVTTPDPPMIERQFKRMVARSRGIKSGKQALERSW
jgi:hypothetical protein